MRFEYEEKLAILRLLSDIAKANNDNKKLAPQDTPLARHGMEILAIDQEDLQTALDLPVIRAMETLRLMSDEKKIDLKTILTNELSLSSTADEKEKGLLPVAAQFLQLPEESQVVELKEIEFVSGRSLQFESTMPIGEVQLGKKLIEVRKNTDGYEGYELEPGDGYIVSITSLDNNLSNDLRQLSPTPMRVVSSSATEYELRGYTVSALTAYDWIEVDLSDYGLKVWMEKGKVVKCGLVLYDKDAIIEFYNR